MVRLAVWKRIEGIKRALDRARGHDQPKEEA